MLSSSVKRKKSYLNIKKHIQLNITWNLQKYFDFDIKTRKIIKCHVADDETHNKLHENIFEIIHINMDYFERVWYHGNVKEENPFLMLLAAPTKEKMDIICKGDKFMRELNKRVEDLNDDNDVLDVIIENEDEILLNSRFDSGFNQGVKEGINQNKIETAKKLLKSNIDIDIISKSTGLSKEQINDLNDDNDVLDVIIENEDEILLNSRFDSGFNQGIKEGINQTKIETARKLLKSNIDIDIISKSTGLSKKQINDLNDDNDVLDVIIENEDEILLNSRFDSGFNQGVNQTKIEIAKKLLNMDMSIENIIKVTNLSKEEIEKLK